MVRVALIPSSYLPALGGVEESTRHLALTLKSAGDAVEVWTGLADASGQPTVATLDGVVVRRFPMPLPAADVRAVRRFVRVAPSGLWHLHRAVRTFRPDVLHVHCFGPNGVYGLALARWTGLPLVVTLHGETVMDDSDVFDVSTVLRTALRRSLRPPTTVTACSGMVLADAEARFGLRPGRGGVVPNGVDLSVRPADAATSALGRTADREDGPAEDQPSEPSRWTPPTERPYLLALGRVVPKKGFDLLVSAYARTQVAAGCTDLVIAGEGPTLSQLREQARTLGVADRVHFPGRLDRESVAEAMADASGFVVPSRLEPFGIVILEAWRAGTPVVATTHGGPAELIRDGVDGRLADPNDPSQLAVALDDLVRDAPGRLALAAAGRNRVQEYSWPAIADRYRKVYWSALHAGGRRLLL